MHDFEDTGVSRKPAEATYSRRHTRTHKLAMRPTIFLLFRLLEGIAREGWNESSETHDDIRPLHDWTGIRLRFMLGLI